MLEIKKVEYFVLWECSFDDSDDGRDFKDRRNYYFQSQEECEKYSQVDSGAWGQKGRVNEMNYKSGATLPKYYNTARDCALDNLKAKDFIKHFKF